MENNKSNENNVEIEAEDNMAYKKRKTRRKPSKGVRKVKIKTKKPRRRR